VVRQTHFAEQRVAPMGFPACEKLNRSNAIWLTFRRTYASGARPGWPGKVVARLMGHTNADVTISVATQVLNASLRTAVDRIGR
jgi:hypothetical protein